MWWVIYKCSGGFINVGYLRTNNWLFTNALGDIQMHKEIYKCSRTFTNVVGDL